LVVVKEDRQLPGSLSACGRRFGRRLPLQFPEGLVQLVRAVESRNAAHDDGNHCQAEQADMETLHETALLLGTTLPLFGISPNGPPRPARERGDTPLTGPAHRLPVACCRSRWPGR